MANRIRKDGGLDRRFKNKTQGCSGCAGIVLLVMVVAISGIVMLLNHI